MKTIIYLFLPFIGFSVQGEVGINTLTPQATFDVMKNNVDITKPDGIIAPRLKGSEVKSKDSLYNTAQKGTIVYVTEGLDIGNTTLKTANVTRVGYYYFDGEVWQPFERDTLETVVKRGNYSPKYITFSGSAPSPTREGALGMNEQTSSMYFGNMNHNHTGSYNLSYGVGALQNLTAGLGNIAVGAYSLNGLTSGQFNTFLGHTSGYNDDIPDKLITGNVNVAVGNASLSNITTGYKNIAIGQSALRDLNTGSYNTIIGQSSGQSITSENKNVMLGVQTGVYVKGENNIFIGTGAGHSNTVNGVETVNNRLVIHSNVNLVPSSSIGTENNVDYSASWTNGLIIGDFALRWLKINGSFIINPSYTTSDSTYTKDVIEKPDGTLGFTDRVSVPIPPATGTYNLQSVDGQLKWIVP